MTPELWTFLGLAVVAIIGYLGSRYTSQQSSRAQQEATRMTEKSIDAEAYTRARESYESAIRQYVAEIARLEATVTARGAQITELEEEIRTCETESRTATSQAEQNARQLRYDLEAVVDQMIAQKQDAERHLGWCTRRVDRLRARLANHEEISEHDPDLQYTP